MNGSGMIYKLWCKDTFKTYYGSTTGDIANRLTHHEFKFKNGIRQFSKRSMTLGKMTPMFFSISLLKAKKVMFSL